ncbi:MAG: OmpA family protein [Desulfatirhabdiaceae bacterium]
MGRLYRVVIVSCLFLFAIGCSSHGVVAPELPSASEKADVVIRLIRGGPPARPQHQMVLLPNEEGETGQMIIKTAAGSQTIDRAYLSTRIDSPDAAPKPPVEMPLEEIQRIFGAALSAMPDSAVHILLYFQLASSELLPESAALIPKIVMLITQRKSTDISLWGHTDRLGTPEFNLKLSQNRANTVSKLLTDTGVPAGYLDVQFFGEKLPRVPTSDGIGEPRNRRVEVVVR